ncbi:hypothetical protein IWW56_002519 [Coemansia sp. RSA 2131]|nr:hypothetical protein IWW56_002519 [Coemansia sp. RSA 2131]
MGEDTVFKFKDEESFKYFINNNNEYMVINFSGTNVIQSMYMNSTFAKLSKEYPNIKFIQLDRYELYRVFYEYKVSKVPTFMFRCEGGFVDMRADSGPKTLTKKVQEYSEQAKITVHKIKDEQLLNELFANNNFLVINFCSTRGNSCFQTNLTFAQLSKKHPKVKFIQLDIYEMSDIFNKSGVVKTPAFMFLCDLDDIRLYYDFNSHYLTMRVEAFSKQAEADQADQAN